MYFFTRFLFNFSLLNYLFDFLGKQDNGRILEYSYKNLAADLNFIGAQFDVNFTYFIFSIPISLIVSTINLKFFKFDFQHDQIESIFRKLLLIAASNLAIVCFTIYFFRLYELLSRIYVLTYLILYPILLILFELMLFSISSKLKNFVYLIFIGIFIFMNINFYSSSLNNVLNRNKVEEDLKIVSEEVISSLGISEEELLENEKCNEWKGTGNFIACLGGIKVTTSKFESQITNLTIFENKVYFIFKEGLVYAQDSDNSTLDLFLDISDIVHTEFPGMSQGLYSLAFHPSGDSFLVSYSNEDIALVISKYNIKNDGSPDVQNPEELLRISNNIKFHFGGSIIWSEYFQGFLVGIGDMRENIMPLVHSDALNTTSYKGKVILLNSDITFKVPLINEHGLYTSINNIVAYGLRNPWQMTEYNNRLFITDVGSQFIEEINEIKYSEYKDQDEPEAVSFGWPLLMGGELSYSFRERNKESMTRLDGKITDLYYWESEKIKKADDYLIENSKSPLLQYDHIVNEDTIRAAIIGGDFIKNGSGKYDNIYFFTDYVENELYGLNVDTKDLIIFPLEQIGNPTSLKANPFRADSILVAYSNGTLLNVQLP